MAYKLYEHQEKALLNLRSGSILCGGVGSGKTLTALSFYLKVYNHLDLYVITTAKKRDSTDWQNDMDALDTYGIVDSWNNIENYINIQNAFFIFDEQRVVGYGKWAKTFIKLAKNNNWILLSATPGDTWIDYIPVFIANGFYKNKTDFIDQHVEYDMYKSYPRIKAYHNEGKLIKNRDLILVHMPVARHTNRNKVTVYSEYDLEAYDIIMKHRWNIFEDKPIENASKLLQCIRRVVGTSQDRILNAKIIMDVTDKLIVFYNYNYELDILIKIAIELGKEYRQWNGHRHDELPNTEEWLYFVQYTSGSEGWNCITTNTIMFYSLNYSYRNMEQAEGRIDRINTPFTNLSYYILMSNSKIEKDIYQTIERKQKFNIIAWARKSGVSF